MRITKVIKGRALSDQVPVMARWGFFSNKKRFLVSLCLSWYLPHTKRRKLRLCRKLETIIDQEKTPRFLMENAFATNHFWKISEHLSSANQTCIAKKSDCFGRTVHKNSPRVTKKRPTTTINFPLFYHSNSSKIVYHRRPSESQHEMPRVERDWPLHFRNQCPGTGKRTNLKSRKCPWFRYPRCGKRNIWVAATRSPARRSWINPLPAELSAQLAQTQGQTAWYQAMVESEMRQIRNWALNWKHICRSGIRAILDKKPIGLSFTEGAWFDRESGHLGKSLRKRSSSLGPHIGPGTYAFGKDSTAPLSPEEALIRKIEKLGIKTRTRHI